MRSEPSQKTGRALVVGYAVLILLTMPIVARMLGSAWDDQGVIYDIVFSLTRTLGVNIDLAVVVPVGFVLALLLLFALDDYKRIQAVLLVGGCFLFLYTLVEMGKWTETVDWTRYWWGLIVGGVAGLVGLSGAHLPSRGRREFPAASRWIYRITVTIVVVGFFEYHLQYRNGLVVQLRDIYLTAPASLLLLLAVGEFVKYSNRKDIVIIGSNDAVEANFLGGLFAEARDRFSGVPLTTDGDRQGPIFLNKAASATDAASLPDRNETDTVRFKFTLGGFFSRQIVVTANRYDPPTERDLDALRKYATTEQSLPESAARFLARHFQVLVPRVVYRALRSESSRMADRLRSADTILLVAPMSDFIRTDRAADDDYESWSSLVTDRPPFYASVYRDLCEIYSRSDRRGIVVATEARLAMQVYEEKETRYPSFSDKAFLSFVDNVVLTGNDPDPDQHRCEVIAVDRGLDESGERPEGFDRLLRSLS